MNIAVLSLTRDRLSYTQHCFESLQENAGCEFDHWILDQASEDGTYRWIEDEYEPAHRPRVWHTRENENLGICVGLNTLLNAVWQVSDPDVIVRFDNDCEVTQPGTLATVCEVALEYDVIVAPHVLGLNNPPAIVGHVQAGEHTISQTRILGGIFMAIPARLFTEEGFRYDERMPAWTGDEAIVPWWLSRGGHAGYLDGWSVNHYLTSDGQRQDDPVYQARKVREMGMVAA